jgi:hypothetical protein
MAGSQVARPGTSISPTGKIHMADAEGESSDMGVPKMDGPERRDRGAGVDGDDCMKLAKQIS